MKPAASQRRLWVGLILLLLLQGEEVIEIHQNLSCLVLVVFLTRSVGGSWESLRRCGCSCKNVLFKNRMWVTCQRFVYLGSTTAQCSSCCRRRFLKVPGICSSSGCKKKKKDLHFSFHNFILERKELLHFIGLYLVSL